MADGGEGTTAALMAALEGQWRTVRTADALGRRIEARYGLTADGLAVIEVAESVGIGLVEPADRDALRANSAGVAPLVIDALDAGATRLIVGLGGTVTTDGGAGLLAGLGAIWLGVDGTVLDPRPGALLALDHVDLTALDPRLADTTIELACDVTNPLLGPSGAAAIFGPQRVRHPNRYRCSTACWPGLPTRWWRPDAPTCASCPAQGRRADSAPHSWHWVPRCGRGSRWLPRRRAWTTPSGAPTWC